MGFVFYYSKINRDKTVTVLYWDPWKHVINTCKKGQLNIAGDRLQRIVKEIKTQLTVGDFNVEYSIQIRVLGIWALRATFEHFLTS